MTEFFDKVRGALSCYTDASDGMLTDCRIILCRFGEDPHKAIAQFWRENTGNFAVIPLFAYGNPPRKELCTQKSLLACLNFMRSALLIVVHTNTSILRQK